MPVSSFFNEILQLIGQGLQETWWLWGFLILWFLFESTWLYWRQELYKLTSEFRPILFEIRIPRENRKDPRAMEQVLMALHQLRNAPADPAERWKDGEVTRWFVLELITFSGEVHFYFRAPEKHRALILSSFYSYYPDVEVVETTDDYISRLPENVQQLHREGNELWGTEMVLAREVAYPIKTYRDFQAETEEKEYDPISVFVEVLAKARKGEFVGIQIIIAPEPPTWRNKWAGLVEKLREAQREKGVADSNYRSLADFPGGPMPAMAVKKSDGEESIKSFSRLFMRTPGETDVLKAVEENLSKPAFKTLIRFIYISPKAIFHDTYARRGLVGSFNQYAALNLNYFLQNYEMSTRLKFWSFPFLFPNLRNEYRKQRLLWMYRHREWQPETFMGKLLTSYPLNWNFKSRTVTLTTQCLATLYHIPTHLVTTAPHIPRVESRKTGPPAGLPIFGGEEEISKYQ